MSALSEYFFKAPPAAVRLQLLEIIHPNFSQPFRVVRNHVPSPINVQHEDDEIVAYQHFPLRIEELGSDNSLDQEIQVTLGDTGSVIPSRLDTIIEANNMRTKPTLKYREYLSNDYVLTAIGPPDWTFDGVDDRISGGNILNFERTDPFTLSIWFKVTSAAAMRMLSNCQPDSTRRGFGLSLLANGRPRIELNNDGNFDANCLKVNSSATGYNDNILHNFVATYDGSSSPAGTVLYIDGSPISTTVQANTLSATIVGTNTYEVGSDSDGLIPTAGVLQHPAVWNTVLTASHVAEVYNSGVFPDLNALPTSPAPIKWWKIDSTDSDATNGVIDHSINNNHGTAQNGLGAPTGNDAAVYTSPVRGPFTLDINSIAFTKQGCTFTAKPAAFNRVRTGEYYTVERFPMLRGFL